MSDYSEIDFKKKFGQNFLSDTNLLSCIVKDAEVTSEDVVLEIGAGAGALTSQLVKVAKKVVAFEIDNDLKPLLLSKFQAIVNLEIIFEDFLHFNEEILYEKLGDRFKVVANLPYYITSPILTKLFKLKHRPSDIVVMVQKEVGERIIAKPADSEYGYFSVFVNSNALAKITRNVNRKMFKPVPKVDSCIVKLKLKDNVYDEAFFDFLKNCFAMKRKTIVNNLEKAYGLNKSVCESLLNDLNLDKRVRADALSQEDLLLIYKAIKRAKCIN